MTFSATLRTDARLAPATTVRQFHLYHANSRLDMAAARALGEAGDGASRYLGTRGFRQFPTPQAVPLDEPLRSRQPLRAVMARRRSGRDLGGTITLAELGSVLEQALGCTGLLSDGGLSHALRAWPSAGGLYPLDTYLAAARVEGLAPAVYHYNAIRQQLEPIPAPPVARFVSQAFFGQPIAEQAAAAVLLIANFERTTSKYGERGYRLVLLDAGHAGQNVLLAAEQYGLAATAIGGFSDEAICQDLGIDGVDEAPVHALLLGRPA